MKVQAIACNICGAALLLLLGAAQLSAAQILIDQVPPGAWAAEPTSETAVVSGNNTPDLGPTPKAETPAALPKGEMDYQKAILGNSYMTPYGRVGVATENEANDGPMETNAPNVAAGAKKSGSDALLQQEARCRQSHHRPVSCGKHGRRNLQASEQLQ